MSHNAIFVSYRRNDNPYAVGAIRDGLVAKFGVDSVFLDVHSIPLGRSFPEALDDALNQCAAALVVIGDEWLNARSADGTRRLDDPHDFVRLEVEAALSRDIPVVPVLVGNARMPPKADLPDSLRDLTQMQAAEVRALDNFQPQLDRLIARLGQVCDYEK